MSKYTILNVINYSTVCYYLLLSPLSTGAITESMCGFEEINQDTEPSEFRPTPPTLYNDTSSGGGAGYQTKGVKTSNIILYVGKLSHKCDYYSQTCFCLTILTESVS